MSEQTLYLEDPYSLHANEKDQFLRQALNELTVHHREHCEVYHKMLAKSGAQSHAARVEDVPFLPVQLFKMVKLSSISPEKEYKTLTSSGTTGQNVSKIYLDKETAMQQSRVLNAIVRSFLGTKRMPMLIIDTDLLKNPKMFSARTAGTLGFSQFGRNHCYLLDQEMQLDETKVDAFLETHAEEPLFIFGFTFMIWEYFYQKYKHANKKLNLQNAILIHGGGWKKLQDQAVDNATFKRCLAEQFGITKVYNYYGMVEQVGSIFMECEHGALHAPNYAEVIVRNGQTFQPCAVGEKGLIQVLSVIPRSYPGHSLLTEDEGVILGRDNCKCGRLGTYFHVLGRLPKAEVRGCSDTFQR